MLETIAPPPAPRVPAPEEHPTNTKPTGSAPLLTVDVGGDTIRKPGPAKGVPTERVMGPAVIPKCPYLAGRPPHGTYHMWPSGVNVCYARTAGDEPFGGVGKDTQDGRCFCAAEVYEQCPDFEQARAQNIALPVFAGAHPATAAPGGSIAPERRHRRERHKRRRRSRAQKWWE